MKTQEKRDGLEKWREAVWAEGEGEERHTCCLFPSASVCVRRRHQCANPLKSNHHSCHARPRPATPQKSRQTPTLPTTQTLGWAGVVPVRGYFPTNRVVCYLQWRISAPTFPVSANAQPPLYIPFGQGPGSPWRRGGARPRGVALDGQPVKHDLPRSRRSRRSRRPPFKRGNVSARSSAAMPLAGRQPG